MKLTGNFYMTERNRILQPHVEYGRSYIKM